jgi:penicillin amidase
MYGDAKGNVAWWATGKLYKHNEGVNTNFILDGASARTTLLSFDFSKILQPKTSMGLCVFGK